MSNYTLELTTNAQQDLSNAISWFEEKRKGLGYDFLIAADSVFNNILSNPYLFQVISAEKNYIRRAFIQTFKYTVFYTIEADLIVIIALLSSRQNPVKWKSRVT